MTCKFCNQPVADKAIEPPLCAKHLDLAIVSEFLTETGEEITVEAVKRLVEGSRKRNRQMSLEPGEVESLMAKDFARRYVAK